jgi:hypothetical protein
MGENTKEGKEEFSSFIHTVNQNWVSKALVAFSGVEGKTLDEHWFR